MSLSRKILRNSLILITAAIFSLLLNQTTQGTEIPQQESDAIQKSLKAAESKYAEAKKSGNKNEEAEALFQIGMSWKNLLVYDKASEYLIQSQKLYEELGDNKKIARNLLQLGELYRATAEFETSINYLRKSLAICEKEDDQIGIGKACERMAATFYETLPGKPQRLDSTFLLITKAITISRAQKNDSLTSSANVILGAAYMLSKKSDIGIAYLQDALKFSESKNLKEDAALIRINLAYGYYDKKEYNTSVDLAKQSYDYAEKNKILPFIDMSTLCLYKCYAEMGEFQSAFNYLKLYEENRWQLYEKDRLHRIKAMQIKYDIEKTEIELEHEKKMAFLWAMIFSLILLIAGAVIAFYFIRNKTMKKKNAELEKKNALISEQNEKLIELNATKDKFFSIIGHDLKNPYQSLIGFSNILIQDYKELTEQEIKEFVGYIFEASEMGNRLLQNLLDWSRSETGRLKYEPEPFYLHEIINEAINLAANTSTQKDISIESSIPENLGVYCDRNMIYTVLRNLVSNAIKFSYRGGKIKISSSVKDSMVEVSVVDCGVGMNDARMEDLFKLDKRVTTDGTENEKGTGLGLYLCKEFIEKNHGSIMVVSQPGNGSTFIFTLPTSSNV